MDRARGPVGRDRTDAGHRRRVLFAGLGLTGLLAVVLGLLLVLIVVARVLSGTEAGRRDDCIDAGGAWVADHAACVRAEDLRAYDRCRDGGRAWDFDRRRCAGQAP